jgi:hypothetical protein
MIYKVIEEIDHGEFILDEPNQYTCHRAKAIPVVLYLLYKITIPLYDYVNHNLANMEKEK